MNTPKISVIIPVYNTESYVGEAINSVQQQTFQDFEIIVINDGSTDRSLEIINGIAETDKRIQVYTQGNLGVSAARNKGLEHVKGEFIYCLDSDDLLESNAFELCFQKCTTENLDFVFFDAQSINPQNKYQAQNYIHEANQEEHIWKGIDLLNYQLDTRTYRPPIWLNFIRTSYLRQYQLSFYPGIIHEDQLFCFLLYIHAARVDYISQTFSKRRLRDNSIMTQKFSRKNIIGYFTVTDEMIQFRKNKSSEIKETTDKYLRSMLNAVIWTAHVLPWSEKWYVLQQCLSKNYIKYIHVRNLLVLFLKSKTTIS